MPSYADRVKHTLTTEGTGTYTLGSAISGFQTFANAGFSDGDEVFYCITMGTSWEVGRGVLGSTQTTLTRDVILASSTGSAIDWGTGDKVLFNDLPAHRLNEMEELNTANGYDLQDPDSQPTVTWDNTTRKITAAVQSGQTSFHYWVDGDKHIHTSSVVSDAISTGTSGTFYFYFNDNDELKVINEASITLDVFYKYAITELVYWNDTDSVGKPYKEKHGYRMDSADHEMEHMTIGARYASGFKLTGLVNATTTFTGAESGKYYDEDIAHSIDAAATMPFLYRLGTESAPYWKWSAADNKVAFMNGGTDTVWNELTGGSWQLTPADTAHDYILIFVVAEGAETGYDNFSKIIDQAGYSTRGNARDAIEGAKKKLILDGLPSPEMCFIGVYIVRKNGNLQDLADGSVYLDLRGTSSRGSGGDSAASNLAADSVVDASGFSDNLSSTDTDVQTALETLDTLSTGIENLVNDTSPQLGGSLDLNSKALTNEYTAGAALVAKDLCYLNSSGQMVKTDADAEATTDGYLALCTETIASDSAGTFIYQGRLTGYSGLTVGGVCYVSGTAGAVTQTRPTTGFVRVVGYADSATSIVFSPSPVWVEI